MSLMAATLLAAAPPQKKPKNPAARAAKLSKIDINSATEAQLRTLPGIGEADAAKIVQSRPYQTKGELKKRKIVPATTYAAIKGQIVARPGGIPQK